MPNDAQSSLQHVYHTMYQKSELSVDVCRHWQYDLISMRVLHVDVDEGATANVLAEVEVIRSIFCNAYAACKCSCKGVRHEIPCYLSLQCRKLQAYTSKAMYNIITKATMQLSITWFQVRGNGAWCKVS